MLKLLRQLLSPTSDTAVAAMPSVPQVISAPQCELFDPDVRPSFMMAVARSSRWMSVRADHLANYPACSACGGTEYLEVHHIRPYHIHPDLELVASNLITLCEAPTRHCHFRVGHSYDWKAYNPHVTNDAALELLRVVRRKYAA